MATSRGASAYSQVTVENLFNERRKEFLFEGQVYFDMKRMQLSLNRVDYNLDEAARNIPFPDDRWAFPIPENDILNNNNLVQNPGYQSK